MAFRTMHLRIGLERSTESHSGELYEGELRRVHRPVSGLCRLTTPPLDLPSGIPLNVFVEWDPQYDTGMLSVESAGVELARVAPLRTPTYLHVRLSSDEVVCIAAVASDG
jgi:hypothetical protein